MNADHGSRMIFLPRWLPLGLMKKRHFAAKMAKYQRRQTDRFT
jgi:hypothetical protein